MSRAAFIGVAPERSGIYLISHSISSSVYVGQSLNIRTRLAEHYETLRTGKHHNQVLQRIWNFHPPESFSTSVYLLCPEGSSALAVQRWLVKTERKAIAEFRQLKKVLNEAAPTIVATKSAVTEFEQKKAAEDRAKSKLLSRERSEVKKRIGELNNQLAALRVARNACASEIAQIQETLRKSKGILAFIFARRSESLQEQENRLAELRKKLGEIDRTLAPGERETEELSRKHRNLYSAFPKVHKRFIKRALWRAFPTFNHLDRTRLTEDD